MKFKHAVTTTATIMALLVSSEAFCEDSDMSFWGSSDKKEAPKAEKKEDKGNVWGSGKDEDKGNVWGSGKDESKKEEPKKEDKGNVWGSGKDE